ncbi:MAG: hypothetical protein ACE5K0_04885 [Candidatus Methanofastidiosia archaeon]
MLRNFPVHFGLIDAYLSADGLLGFFRKDQFSEIPEISDEISKDKEDYTPKLMKTIIEGENLLAVDMVGVFKMGLNPKCSIILEKAIEEFGEPEVEWIGDRSVYENWVNVPLLLDRFLDFAEEFYLLANCFGEILSEMDPYFKEKRKNLMVKILRKAFLWIYRILDRVLS